jgi:hypothetical protein
MSGRLMTKKISGLMIWRQSVHCGKVPGSLQPADSAGEFVLKPFAVLPGIGRRLDIPGTAHSSPDALEWVDFSTMRPEWVVEAGFFAPERTSDACQLGRRSTPHGIGYAEEVIAIAALAQAVGTSTSCARVARVMNPIR